MPGDRHGGQPGHAAAAPLKQVGRRALPVAAHRHCQGGAVAGPGGDLEIERSRLGQPLEHLREAIVECPVPHVSGHRSGHQKVIGDRVFEHRIHIGPLVFMHRRLGTGGQIEAHQHLAVAAQIGDCPGPAGAGPRMALYAQLVFDPSGGDGPPAGALRHVQRPARTRPAALHRDHGPRLVSVKARNVSRVLKHQCLGAGGDVQPVEIEHGPVAPVVHHEVVERAVGEPLLVTHGGALMRRHIAQAEFGALGVGQEHVIVLVARVVVPAGHMAAVMGPVDPVDRVRMRDGPWRAAVAFGDVDRRLAVHRGDPQELAAVRRDPMPPRLGRAGIKGLERNQRRQVRGHDGRMRRGPHVALRSVHKHHACPQEHARGAEVLHPVSQPKGPP